MSPIETQEVMSEDTVETSDNDNIKVVPIAESIRYRRRAQSAEKKLEELTEQLAKAKTQTAKLSAQLSDIQAEQKLTRKLAVAGTTDLETAVLIAKARLRDQKDADLDSVIEQLKNEKQHLFTGNSGVATTQKTAGCLSWNSHLKHLPRMTTAILPLTAPMQTSFTPTMHFMSTVYTSKPKAGMSSSFSRIPVRNFLM